MSKLTPIAAEIAALLHPDMCIEGREQRHEWYLAALQADGAYSYSCGWCHATKTSDEMVYGEYRGKKY